MSMLVDATINRSLIWGNSFPQLYSSVLVNIAEKICVVLNRKVCSSSFALLLSPNYESATSLFASVSEKSGTEVALEWLHGNYFLELGYVGLDFFNCDDPVSKLVEDGFSFVSTLRDPLARLQSYYRAAIDRKLVYSRYDSSVLVGTSFYNYVSVKSFEDFVDKVCFDDLFSRSDPHWISQLSILRRDLVPSLIIVESTNFDVEAIQLCDRLMNEARVVPQINRTRIQMPDEFSFEISMLAKEKLLAEAKSLVNLKFAI